VSVNSTNNPLRVLPAKTLRLAQQNIGPGENVHVCLVGVRGQAMVALDDRLLVLKAGFMAGATFGGKATSFPYDQITGIEVQHGPLTGVLRVETASFPGGLSGGYWAQDNDRNPWRLPNCIPIQSQAAATLQPYLALIRDRIAKGFWSDGIGPAASQSEVVPKEEASNDLASQLSTLGELHSSGTLSDEEFEQAKRKLLD